MPAHGPEPSEDPVHDRDRFLREVLRTLAGSLEEVVGLEEAEGFVSLVGQQLAARIDARYRREWGVERLDPTQVARALVDLKQRIQGGFRILELTAERLVLVNDRCPFGDAVLDRPSLCMMTSNVFGTIAAENLGYARVIVEQAIARRDPGCRIVVQFTAEQPAPPEAREYFRSGI